MGDNVHHGVAVSLCVTGPDDGGDDVRVIELHSQCSSGEQCLSSSAMTLWALLCSSA